jgi:hypothetical protein
MSLHQDKQFDRTVKDQPLAGSALGSMVDLTAHRDQLGATNAVYE